MTTALPVLAQDTLPTPTESTVPVWVALVISLAGIVVSAIASGGTVWMIVNRAIDKTRNDPVAMKNAEAAASGIPQAFGLALLEVMKTLRNATDLGIELLDGIPADEKSAKGEQTISATSNTGFPSSTVTYSGEYRPLGFSVSNSEFERFIRRL